MARPFKEDKKLPIALKLPPYLLEWLDRQPESRAFLIEAALCGWYQIPDSLKPEPQTPAIRNASPRSRTKGHTQATSLPDDPKKTEKSNAPKGKKTD
jgi:hypothetical protein